MKKSLLVFFYITLLTFSNAYSSNINGGTITNGGNGFVAEFNVYIQEIIIRMSYDSDLVTYRRGFQKKLKSLNFKVAPRLYFDGFEVSAINQPNSKPPLITISERLWPLHSLEQKRILTIHELLAVSGFKDSSYSLSRGLYWRLFPETPPSNVVLNCLDVSGYVAKYSDVATACSVSCDKQGVSIQDEDFVLCINSCAVKHIETFGKKEHRCY